MRAVEWEKGVGAEVKKHYQKLESRPQSWCQVYFLQTLNPSEAHIHTSNPVLAAI